MSTRTTRTTRTSTSARWPRRALALLLALLLTGGGLAMTGGAARPTPAYALGPGRVCVFLAPQGAPLAGFYAGHVGWAFLEGGTSNWIFGATENRSGWPFVKPGDNNYAWVSNGPWDSVLATFAGQLVIGGTFYHGADYYTQFRCQNTSNSSVGAAVARANAIKGYGYGFVTDNCLDHAYNVLTTYGGSMVYPASNSGFWTPNGWFAALGVFSGFGPVSYLASER